MRILSRDKDVSMRTSESLERANVSESNIKNWFDNVEKYLKDDGHLKILKDPTRIFNADENGFQLYPQPKKVLAKRGAKNIYNVEASNPKEIVTVYCIENIQFMCLR